MSDEKIRIFLFHQIIPFSVFTKGEILKRWWQFFSGDFLEILIWQLISQSIFMPELTDFCGHYHVRNSEWALILDNDDDDDDDDGSPDFRKIA